MEELEYYATLATLCVVNYNYATLALVDILARNILAFDIAPPHRYYTAWFSVLVDNSLRLAQKLQKPQQCQFIKFSSLLLKTPVVSDGNICSTLSLV